MTPNQLLEEMASHSLPLRSNRSKPKARKIPVGRFVSVMSGLDLQKELIERAVRRERQAEVKVSPVKAMCKAVANAIHNFQPSETLTIRLR